MIVGVCLENAISAILRSSGARRYCWRSQAASLLDISLHSADPKPGLIPAKSSTALEAASTWRTWPVEQGSVQLRRGK